MFGEKERTKWVDLLVSQPDGYRVIANGWTPNPIPKQIRVILDYRGGLDVRDGHGLIDSWFPASVSLGILEAFESGTEYQNNWASRISSGGYGIRVTQDGAITFRGRHVQASIDQAFGLYEFLKQNEDTIFMNVSEGRDA